MKNTIKIIVCCLILFHFSCDDSLDEINVDPNTFPSADDPQVLTSSLGFLGYIVDADLNYSDSFVWSQYYTWGIGVAIGNSERYVQQAGDHDGYWSRAYASSLADLDYIDRNSTNKAYRGISKVLKVYIFQGLVDHFGDIPFTEALLGAIEDGSNFSPNYDSAETVIYPALVTMLDDAIEELSTADDDDIDVIGSDDLLYQGDISKWMKFANSLKLRVLMRTSEVSSQSSVVQDLISSGTFIETIDDMPSITYSGATGNQNPMYALAEAGVGMFYFASNSTLNVLQNLNDPRDEVFYTLATTGTFADNLHGIDQGTIDDEDFTASDSDYSLASDYAYGEANPVILMSPWEVWFLRAEADARYGTSDDETNAFETAIDLNFTYMGLDASSYINVLDYTSSESLDDKLDVIGIQKWISLNGTQEDEGWIEARRFDRPASRIFTDGIWQTPPLSVLASGEFPSIWLYPSTERSLNPNAPAQRTITDNIFWDN